MQFNCVVIASYTLGFLKSKNLWLVFRLKHEISKDNFFASSFMEKMLVIQFHSMEKMLIIHFHSFEKCLSYNFIVWKKCLTYNFIVVLKNAYHTISYMEKMLILLISYIHFYSLKWYERE